MRSICVLLISVFIFSCTGNHYHDGKYKGRMGGLSFNVHDQVLTVNGNEILVEKYTLGGKLFDKAIVSCTQYPDRIEYKDLGGVTRILNIHGTDLRLNDYEVFRKLNKEVMQSSQSESMDLVKKKQYQELKANSLKRKEVSKNNPPFEGTRLFEDDDGIYKREVTITRNKIAIRIFAGEKNLNEKDHVNPLGTETGYFKNGKIYIKDGDTYIDNLYWFKKGQLFVNYDLGD